MLKVIFTLFYLSTSEIDKRNELYFAKTKKTSIF